MKKVPLLVSLVMVSLLAMPTSSYAAVSPCGTSANRFAGGASSFQVSLWGAKASVQLFDPDLCGNTSVSVAWSMVTAASLDTSDASGWAQAGYGRFGTNAGFSQSGLQVFAQWNRWCKNDGSSCASLTTRFNPAPSGTEVYKAVYRSADNHIHMYVNDDQIAETDYDPTNSHWDGAWSAQYAGETLHLQTDVPGTSGNRVLFSNLQKSTSSTPDWHDLNNFSFVNAPDRYHRQFVDSSQNTDFNIWTNPLNSV
jgi:hypothetical protein